MTGAARTTSNDSKDPRKKDPDHPGRNDGREPGGDVKEPPLPGTAGNEEKFPRKGDI